MYNIYTFPLVRFLHEKQKWIGCGDVFRFFFFRLIKIEKEILVPEKLLKIVAECFNHA